MHSSKKLRFWSVCLVSFFLVANLLAYVYLSLSYHLSIKEIGAGVPQVLNFYLPVAMLIVGHLVATHGVEKEGCVSSLYFVSYFLFLMLYLSSPIAAMFLYDRLIDGLEGAKIIHSTIELPLFLLVGIIFTSKT